MKAFTAAAALELELELSNSIEVLLVKERRVAESSAPTKAGSVAKNPRMAVMRKQVL
jgi:hypothetical protein